MRGKSIIFTGDGNGGAECQEECGSEAISAESFMSRAKKSTDYGSRY